MDKEKKRKRNLVLNGIAIPIGNMVFQTYLVGAGASSLREAIKLFWTFRVPCSHRSTISLRTASCPRLRRRLSRPSTTSFNIIIIICII